MKIVLAAPIRNEPADPHYYWARALRSLGHQVKLFPLSSSSRLVNSWRLFYILARFKPDQIFFSAGRDACLPVKDTVFFCGVPLSWLSRSERATGLLAKLVIVNDRRHSLQWQMAGAKKAVVLPISAVHPPAFKLKKLKRVFQVSFVGTPFPERQRFLKRLTKVLPRLGQVYRGGVWGAGMAGIYQRSLIGLNLSPTHMDKGGNIRPFEIAASGALLLTDQLNPDWFAGEKEAVEFRGVKDCAQKINYYLSRPALLKQISRAGRRRALKDHTYRRRFAKLLKLL